MVRLHFSGGAGPAQEVHAGSGYWSQDSAVVVLGVPEPPRRITVLWPGGKKVEATLPAGSREVSVDYSGAAKVVH